MKRFLLLLPLSLLLGACSHVPSSPVSADLRPAIAATERTEKTLDQALQTKVVAQKDEAIAEAKTEVASVESTLQSQQTNITTLTAQRDWWQNDDQNKDDVINKAYKPKIEKLENRVTHLEHLLFICSALFSIVCMAVGWQLFKSIPYGPWLVAGVGVVAFSSAWFALGHLL
jgi:septal ring factor EnvC (AmiA/AmiB activator)